MKRLFRYITALMITCILLVCFNPSNIKVSADGTHTQNLTITGYASGSSVYCNGYYFSSSWVGATDSNGNMPSGVTSGSYSSYPVISGTSYRSEYKFYTDQNDKSTQCRITFPDVYDTVDITFSVYFRISGSEYGPNAGGRFTITGQSNTLSFTVKGAKASTQLIKPDVTATNLTNDSVTLTWEPIDKASNYEVLYNTRNSVTGAQSITTCSHNINLTELLTNTTYYIFIRANTNTTGYSASPYTSLTIKTLQYLLDDCTLNSLVAISDNCVQCNYTAVENATGYIIEYSTDEVFSNKQTLAV